MNHVYVKKSVGRKSGVGPWVTVSVISGYPFLAYTDSENPFLTLQRHPRKTEILYPHFVWSMFLKTGNRSSGCFLRWTTQIRSRGFWQRCWVTLGRLLPFGF